MRSGELSRLCPISEGELDLLLSFGAARNDDHLLKEQLKQLLA